jgi:CheY-like chemotaxis protein
VNRQEAVIRVADNGIGIDPELMPRIFDLFVQSSRTLDRSHGGLGIGLTVAERLVRLHRGVIEASSDGLGKGCEFVVRLPLSEAPSGRPEPPASDPAVSRSLRMLIVDDNEDAAASMALLQELRGHVTRTAANGTDALKIAADFVPQVVLLDIGLPGMDGFEVARRLRELPGMKNTFLVALTGYGSQGDRQRADEAGFNEHLVKPADMNLLGGLLARVPSGE